MDARFRIRIYPTPAQEQEFLRIAGCCRLVYNLCLDQRRNFYRQIKAATGHYPTAISQARELKDLKADLGFLKDCPSHCLMISVQNLQAAFVNFWEGRAEYPAFKRKGEKDAFTFPDPKQFRIPAEADKRAEIVLPKFGKRKGDHGPVRAVIHRPIPGEMRQVTILREGNAWYASVLVRTDAEPPVIQDPITEDDVAGADRGVVVPVATSAGEKLGGRVETKGARKKKRRLQRQLARTQKGSNRRRKALKRLRAHCAKQTRRRNDMTHQITNRLAKNHRVVVIEALDVAAMTASAKGTAEAPGKNVAQKAGLNRSVLDVGWGQIRTRLRYKLERRGGVLVEVRAAYTSCTCARCGVVDTASRVSRGRFACVACGHAADADVNAAIEIRRRGLEALGLPAGTVGTARGAPDSASRARGAVKRETKGTPDAAKAA